MPSGKAGNTVVIDKPAGRISGVVVLETDVPEHARMEIAVDGTASIPAP